MKSLGLVVFRGAEDVPKFSQDFGFEINGEGYLEKEGKIIKCDCCENDLKSNKLGTILPGSDIYYCDNAACLSKYINEHLEKQ